MSRLSRFLTSLIFLALLVGVFCPAAPAYAAPPYQSNAIQLDARVGFDGYVQSGAWTPITVTAANDGPDVLAEVRVTVDPFTGSRTHYTRPLDLPRGSRKQVTLYAADVTGFGSEVQVELLDERGRVLQAVAVRVETISPTTLLIGVWSSTPQGLAGLALVEPSSGETRVATLTADDLPPDAKGWEALDVLAVSDVDTGALSAAQREALAMWLAGGGRLIIVGGVGYQRTLAGLVDVSPVRAEAVESLPVGALADLLGAAAAAGVPDGAAQVAVGPLSDDARVLVAEGGTPLIAWRPVGYGRVDFFGPDPALAPLAGWDGLTDVWRAILADGRPRPSWGYGLSDQWSYARDAVAAVPGITLPSVLQLCGFLALYVVLIGPVNYIVLTRLKRRELAWLTIPALILVFSAITYITGFQLRGSTAVVHRLAVVQGWEGSDVAAVDGMIGVWSPRRARYDVELEPGLFSRPLPSDLGGALGTATTAHVEQVENFRLSDVAVDIGSITPFTVEGFVEMGTGISADLALAPEGDSIHIAGRIHNAGTLDLSETSLLVGGTLVSLGDLPAGASIDVDEALTGGRAVRGGASALDPFPLEIAGYYLGGPYDSLVAQVSGGECFGARDIQRRCNLMRSVMNGQVQGRGVYLFGWADAVPFDADVVEGRSETVDLALHIVQLDAVLEPGEQGVLEIPPGLVQWQILTQDGYGFASPYDLYMYPGQQFAFRFEPSPLVPRLDVEAVSIHMESNIASDLPPILQVRNVNTGRWETLEAELGTTVLDAPRQYVDAVGGIDLRLIGEEASFGTQISRFDVTFHGTPVGERSERSE